MDFKTAFNEAKRQSGLTDEQIAVAVGVRAVQVWKWRAGRAEPRLSQYQKLRESLPAFAALMDGKGVLA